MESVKSLVENKVFVLLGATSALGPFDTLISIGATVAAVARPGKKIQALIEKSKTSAGTVLLPCKNGCGAESAGADLIADAPDLAQWIISLEPSKEIVLCGLAYLDGERHVRASVAMDAICETVMAARKKASLANLASPGTAHVTTAEAAEVASARFDASPLWHAPFRALGGAFAKNARAPVPGTNLRVIDGISNIQGPNYAVAKTLQQWRAMVARSRGHVVSANHAPGARTESMVSHSTIAAALEGMQAFEPMVAFDAPTASGLMAGLMLWDLGSKESDANPGKALEHPMCLLASNAVHGGMWRTAYTVDSIGACAFLYGKVREWNVAPKGVTL